MDRNDLDSLVVWVNGISFREATPDWRIPRSIVPLHVLALFTRGSGRWEIDGTVYTPGSGDLLYVPQGSIREARPDPASPAHFFALRLSVGRVGDIKETGHLALLPEENVPLPLPTLHRTRRYNQILGLMQRLRDEWTPLRPGRRLYGHSLATQVLLLAHEGASPVSVPKAARRVEKAIACIHSCYAEPLTVQELAAEADLSVRQFRTVFQELTGLSPMAYLQQHRLERAKAMLLSGKGTVQEIAQAVGYGDQAYFARVFRRATGTTPSAFAHTPQVE